MADEKEGDEIWMDLAIEVAGKSVREHGRLVAPMVGAVLVNQQGDLLGTAYRGKSGEGHHAEFALLSALEEQGINASGCRLFTTLEPCSRRGRGKRSCAERVIEAGIIEVVIGSFDPNPKIYREGWKMMRDVGISLRDFTNERRARVRELNGAFDDMFREGVGPVGEARFDYLQNDGRFRIWVDDAKVLYVDTRWSMRGHGSIYAYGGRPGLVSHARYASSFAEIDDPGALDFENSSVACSEGEIVVFATASHWALVKVDEVHSGAPWGSDHTSVTIGFEIHVRNG